MHHVANRICIDFRRDSVSGRKLARLVEERSAGYGELGGDFFKQVQYNFCSNFLKFLKITMFQWTILEKRLELSKK